MATVSQKTTSVVTPGNTTLTNGGKRTHKTWTHALRTTLINNSANKQTNNRTSKHQYINQNPKIITAPITPSGCSSLAWLYGGLAATPPMTRKNKTFFVLFHLNEYCIIPDWKLNMQRNSSYPSPPWHDWLTQIHTLRGKFPGGYNRPWAASDTRARLAALAHRIGRLKWWAGAEYN